MRSQSEIHRHVFQLLFTGFLLWFCVLIGMANTQKPPVVVKDQDGVRKIVLLPPGPGNPRNSEGDFIQLKDGRVMFVYTHFTSGGGDNAGAYLAARFSKDNGLTWTSEDVTVIPNEGDMNVMSVSLLRLASGEIALFYLRKNSLADCRPIMRVSVDEAKTWGEPAVCITDEMGYYVVNNDRVVQLRSGRLVIPTSQHARADGKWLKGIAMCYLSDDNGKTWRRSASILDKAADGKRVDLQEPGVVELRDGRLMMFCRTRLGCQYVSFSRDGGDTWSAPGRSNILSPLSPATIERIPSTGDLLLAWNDHSHIPDNLRDKRTPFCVAISKDDGETWQNVKVLENNPDGWYCYTAMDFVGDRVLLGHCAGNRAEGTGLSVTQITTFKVSWLYRSMIRREVAPHRP